MFTGIITHLGICQKKTEEGFVFKAPLDLIEQLKNGSSIAVNGVCLTVSKINKSSFMVNVIPETWFRTALRTIKEGSLVNLELPLSINSRFEGHIVYGHVDGVGKIKHIRKESNSRIFTFSVPQRLTTYMVPKGSIAVNGISLTLIDVSSDSFTVGIIPYTFAHTMLKIGRVGDLINIEVDILAKYFLKFFRNTFNKKSIYGN